MKRSMVLVAILVVVVLVAVQVALAGGGGMGGHAYGKAKFQLNATIVSVDATTGFVTVLVKNGSKQVKAYRGLELTLVIAPDARFVDGTAEDGDAASALTAADLVAGMRVHLGGRIDRTDPLNPIYTARKVIVQRWPAVLPPSPTPEPSPTTSTEPTPEPTPSATEGV